ncbi:DUF4832 domain-containing protein [Paenibacillus sp. p3-SID867]|uniref:DUF4832 domain-containing protein n=1 Tax=Paenibacillus sp. p3-SID867 TaxID=2916363 RepID=UPI0021A39722|nr:DUF4832 domain-containing protein [Paenibacillus sp. p3-SID867]MCT1402678.1 DUF4832 domain-containing protein [Paenibacillus sp. p3-SID867]
MGKYSLENYEKYKTVKIRPQPLLNREFDVSQGPFEYVSFFWRALEPVRGEYRLEAIKEALRTAHNPILVLVPELPIWVQGYEPDCFAALVRKIGSYIDSDRRLTAVLISTLADSKEEWNAYVESFETQTLLAELQNDRLIQHVRDRGRGFGLLVKCGEENWIECCEAFAIHRLQKVWKRYQVVLDVTDNVCGPHTRREAYRWHAALSNLNIGLGYHLTLRRLTYPETVYSRGSLPLRFWFVNEGSSRIYREFQLWVQLQQGEVSYEYPLHAATHSWLTGDLVHNEMVPLKDMLPGEYKLSIALFFEDRSYIPLHIQNPQQDGYYEAGMIQVEISDEDPLRNIWDDYDPEGYYPLEDPVIPEQE